MFKNPHLHVVLEIILQSTSPKGVFSILFVNNTNSVKNLLIINLFYKFLKDSVYISLDKLIACH